MERRNLIKLGAAIVKLALAIVIWRWQAESLRPLQQPIPAAIVWRPATAAERQAAMASIKSQLDAFAKDDYKRAVFYQSAGLKRNFPSVAAFRQMMKTVYPQFTKYKTVQFGPAQADPPGHLVRIPVTLTGRDGVTVRALYLMVLENKIFRVGGVAGGMAGGRAPGPPRQRHSAPAASA